MRDYDVNFLVPPLPPCYSLSWKQKVYRKWFNDGASGSKNHIIRTEMTLEEIVKSFKKRGETVDSITEIEWTKNAKIPIFTG